jgi:hypothetical protein
MNKSRKLRIYSNVLIWKISLHTNLLTQVNSYEVIIDNAPLKLSDWKSLLNLGINFFRNLPLESRVNYKPTTSRIICFTWGSTMNMLHSFEKYLHLPDDALMKIRRPIAGTFFLVDYINAQYLKSACWTCDVACWAKMSLMLTSSLFTCESLP